LIDNLTDNLDEQFESVEVDLNEDVEPDWVDRD
jgi:hypothetical protein